VVALVVLALALSLSQVGAQGIETPPCGFEVPATLSGQAGSDQPSVGLSPGQPARAPATGQQVSPAAGPPQLAALKTATELKTDGKIGLIGQTLNLTATLKPKADGKPVHAHTVRFRVDGALVGTDKTDGKGVAKVSYKVPNQFGAKKIEAEFAGNQICAAAKDDATLGTLKASTKITAKLLNPNEPLREGSTFHATGNIVRTSDQDGLDGREILASIGGKEIFRAATNPAGHFYVPYKVPAGFGAKSSKVELRFEGDPLYVPTVAEVAFTVLPPLKDAFLRWSGAEGKVGENATLSAMLSTSNVWMPNTGIAGKSVRFWLVKDENHSITLGTGVTNGQGVAKVQFKIDALPKLYQIRAHVDGVLGELDVEKLYNQSGNLQVNKAPVTLTVSGPGSAKIGDTITVTVKVLRATDNAPVKLVEVSVQNLTKKTDDAGTVSINYPINAAEGTGPRQLAVKALGAAYTLEGSASKTIQVGAKTN
jgi:hypothetical protein